MNILLINAPIRLKKFQNPLMFGQEPLNIAYIASVLIKKGHKVLIKDYDVEGYDKNKLIQLCKEFSCDLLGISCTSSAFSSAVKITKDIKDKTDILVVLGGKHPSSMPKRTLEESKADFVIYGEGEETMTELIDAIRGGKSYSNIKGIVYLEDNKAKVNSPRLLIEDLDKLPFPARELLPLSRYRSYSTGEKFSNIQTSRGCPFSCIYCYNSKSDPSSKKIRFRSVTNIIKEIKHIKKKHRIKMFSFIDDNFTINPKRVNEFCDAIIENNLKITFSILGRVDSADLETYKKLKKAGCDLISYGIESGDDKILKDINKKATVAQAKKAIKLTKETGIKARGNFIVGFPTDTKETIIKTIELAKTMNLYQTAFFMLTPYPHSVLWDEAVAKGIIDEEKINWDTFDQFHSYFTNETLTTQVLQNYLDFGYIYSATRFRQLVSGFLSSHNKKNFLKNWFDIKIKRNVPTL